MKKVSPYHLRTTRGFHARVLSWSGFFLQAFPNGKKRLHKQWGLASLLCIRECDFEKIGEIFKTQQYCSVNGVSFYPLCAIENGVNNPTFQVQVPSIDIQYNSNFCICCDEGNPGLYPTDK